MRAHAGNEVIGDFAANADIILPTMSMTVSKTTDKVSVDCGTTQTLGIMVDVYRRDLSEFKSRIGSQGATPFVANFSLNPKFDIKSGDKIDVYCKLNRGDIAARTFTVP